MRTRDIKNGEGTKIVYDTGPAGSFVILTVPKPPATGGGTTTPVSGIR